MGARRVVANPAPTRVRRSAADPAVLAFHRGWPGYSPTPLRRAPAAARALGVAAVWVKDESARLGMPSFKILGASWAAHRMLCSMLGADPRRLSLADLAERLAPLRPLVLVAATDGNHGRAVARVAALLGLDAHILVPSNMAPARIEALHGEGARITVVHGGYDDAVAASAELADDRHVVISDTAWPGYVGPPSWVIDGYSTLSQEIDQQLAQLGVPEPTWVGVQTGVGAFAASIVRHFGTTCSVVGVEPTMADCVLASIEAGRPVRIPGPQDSIMSGLNCGTPSLVAWPDVRDGIDWFAAVEDADAVLAMRVLAEDGIVAGESGAAGLAGFLAFRSELGLRPDDTVLVVSTEGATDPAGYQRAVGRPADTIATGEGTRSCAH